MRLNEQRYKRSMAGSRGRIEASKCRKVAERLGKEVAETRMSTKRNRLIDWKR